MSIFSTTFTQIRRTPYQALAAIMVLTLTFIIVTVFTFIFFGANKILNYFESAPQVIAFFEKGEDLSEEETLAIKDELYSTGKLSSFRYVSTREAEAIYKEKNKNDPLLLELVDYKILPPSIEVSATEIEGLDDLKAILEKQPKVTEVVFYEDVVKTLSLWVKNLRVIGIILITYLVIQSILILMLIVNLKIQGKREEIEVLRLVGASFGFIARPFIIEGIIYGVVGAFLGYLITASILMYVTPMIVNWIGEIPLFPVSLMFLSLVFAVEIFIGGFLGMISSFIGVKRFVREE
jgi:cell division transport system permease protein